MDCVVRLEWEWREGRESEEVERERLGAAVMSWMMLRSKTVPA